MKKQWLSAFVLGGAAAVASCKDKEIKFEDSPLITVQSPTKNQAIEDSDSVRVQAVLENKAKSPIQSISVWLLNSQKQYIYHEEWPCACEKEKLILVKTAFLYDIDKTADLLLHLDALLEDGTSMREEVPFRLVNK